MTVQCNHLSSYQIYHLCIIFPIRIRFRTSLCWHQVGVRGQLWVWWVPSIRWKRKVCWTLCSTWEEFLGQHGNNNHTYTHKQKFVYEWELNRWADQNTGYETEAAVTRVNDFASKTATSEVPLSKALDLQLWFRCEMLQEHLEKKTYDWIKFEWY